MPNRTDLVAGGILVAAGLVGAVLWPQLPGELAIHFDASGTPDDYVSKPVGIALAPIIGLVTLGAVRLAIRVDPTADRSVADATVLFLGSVIAYIHVLVLGYNLGYRFSMSVALVPVFVAAAGLVGYALVREGVL
jgi:uncharacterized membrane protein